MTQSRNEAMARMVEEAQRRGSNAIVAMRFDSGSIGQWSEICAYGTAVWVNPLTDAAKRQYAAMVASGELPHQQGYAVNVSEWRSGSPAGGPPPRPPPPRWRRLLGRLAAPHLAQGAPTSPALANPDRAAKLDRSFAAITW